MANDYVAWESGFVDTDVVPDTPVQNIVWAADYAEANKLGQFYAPSGGEWWQQAALYGVTRGIDAAFMNSAVNKTAQPATFAGANGRTYAAGQGGAGIGGMSPLVLLLIGGALIYALAD